jgi:transcription termination/antitermination protein NusG
MTDTVIPQDETVPPQPEATEAAQPEVVVPQVETKWFVLRVVSGKEKKVKEYLDKEIARSGWSNIVKQVFLPVEKVYKVLNGKKSSTRKKLLSRLRNDRNRKR